MRYRYRGRPRVWVEYVNSEGVACRVSFMFSPQRFRKETVQEARGWRVFLKSPGRPGLVFTPEAEEEDIREGLQAYAELMRWQRIRRWWVGNAYGEPVTRSCLDELSEKDSQEYREISQ